MTSNYLSVIAVGVNFAIMAVIIIFTYKNVSKNISDKNHDNP